MAKVSGVGPAGEYPRGEKIEEISRKGDPKQVAKISKEKINKSIAPKVRQFGKYSPSLKKEEKIRSFEREAAPLNKSALKNKKEVTKATAVTLSKLRGRGR